MKLPEKILITAALPYANGALHLGHLAGVYLPADCYSRFARMQGSKVLSICGSDEYGVAIALSAQLAQHTPQEHIQIYHTINENILKKLDIEFDFFSRTTNEFHIPRVQQFFKDLYDNGWIYQHTSLQLYAPQEQKFLADRYVVGTCPKCGFEQARGDECSSCGAYYEATELKNPRSKLTLEPLILKETEHFFLKFEAFKESLTNFLKDKPWKRNVTAFAQEYVDQIKPRAITRDLNWGVPVPVKGMEHKVLYVWFDAPIGYISATQQWAHHQGRVDAWKEFWCDPKTHYVQFLGKDNIPFHAVFFPAMVMGQNEPYKLVDDLVANEFYNLEGKKFSKSEGWSIELDTFLEKFDVDQLRYMLAATAPEQADSEFSWDEFYIKCNRELLGKFGNFVHRVLSFIVTHHQGKITQVNLDQHLHQKVVLQAHALYEQIQESYATYRLRKVTQLLMELVHVGNAYFDAQAPWKLAKLPDKKEELNATLYLCIWILKKLALASFPIMPTTAQRLWQMIGEQSALNNTDWAQGDQPPCSKDIKPPTMLFNKIEESMIEEEKQKLVAPEPKVEFKPHISFEEFSKVDLRVGEILEAVKVEKSNKLLHLTVDIGERRKIVAGLATHYQPQELIGKKVVVVANLKPAKLMGIESQGMILAASHEGVVQVLELSGMTAGDEVR